MYSDESIDIVPTYFEDSESTYMQICEISNLRDLWQNSDPLSLYLMQTLIPYLFLLMLEDTAV